MWSIQFRKFIKLTLDKGLVLWYNESVSGWALIKS